MFKGLKGGMRRSSAVGGSGRISGSRFTGRQAAPGVTRPAFMPETPQEQTRDASKARRVDSISK